jgi:hypothetical protein
MYLQHSNSDINNRKDETDNQYLDETTRSDCTTDDDEVCKRNAKRKQDGITCDLKE